MPAPTEFHRGDITRAVKDIRAEPFLNAAVDIAIAQLVKPAQAAALASPPSGAQWQRIMELARNAAARAHVEGLLLGPGFSEHSGASIACPHPDCALFAPAPPESKK